MIKKSLLTILALTSFYAAGAQTFTPDKNGHVADPKFRQLIKSRGYELVGAFDTLQRDPLIVAAPFQKKGKWGKIDNHGKVIDEANAIDFHTPPVPREVKGDPFLNEGSARGTATPYRAPKQALFTKFSKNGKYGTKDADEKEGIPPIYDQVLLYNDSVAYVKQGALFGVFNPDGKAIVPVMYDYIAYSYNQGDAFIVKKEKVYGVFFHNKEILPLQYDRIAFDSHYKTLIKATTGDKTALFNLAGKQLTLVNYNQISDFNTYGVATYRIGTGADVKMGLVDTLGRQISTKEYHEISVFSPKLFKVAEGVYPNQQTGLIDLQGKPASQMDYNRIDYLSNVGAKVTRDNLVGMIDSTGKEIIKPDYTQIGYFNKNGLAVVKKDGKFGLLSKTGAMVVLPAYDLIDDNYSRKQYFITQNNKRGLMDGQGKVMLAPTYDLLYPITTYGYRAGLNKKEGLLDNTGAVIAPLKYDMIGPEQGYKVLDQGIFKAVLNGKKYLADLYGNEYAEQAPVEKTVNFSPDKDGYVAGADFAQFIKQRGFQLVSAFDTVSKKPLLFAARVMVDGKWRLMDNKGQYHNNPETPYVNVDVVPSYRGGSSDITIDEPVGTQNPVATGFEQVVINGKYGTQNKTNNTIGLPAIYDNLTFMGKGWVMTKLGAKYGMAMDNGQVTLQPKYESITPAINKGGFDFSSFYVRENGKYGLISSSGAQIIPVKYDQLQSNYGADKSGQLLKFSLDKKWGLITKTGKILAPASYNELSYLQPGLIKTTVGTAYPKLYGIVDTTGKEILPPIYQTVETNIFGKRIRISINNGGGDKMGYLSLTGKMLFKPVYDEIYELPNGIARVKLNGKYGLMGANEKFIIEPKYDELYISPASQLLVVEIAGKKGVIDMQGKKVIAIEYTQLYRANGNYVFKRNEKWGIMNQKEKVIATLDYQEITQDFNCFIVYTNGRYGLMAYDGNLITPVKYSRFPSGSNTMNHGLTDTRLNDTRLVIDRYGNEYSGSVSSRDSNY